MMTLIRRATSNVSCSGRFKSAQSTIRHFLEEYRQHSYIGYPQIKPPHLLLWPPYIRKTRPIDAYFFFPFGWSGVGAPYFALRRI